MVAQFIRLPHGPIVRFLLAIGFMLAVLSLSDRPLLATAQNLDGPEVPLQIADVSIVPAPIVGQSATLSISIVSAQDEPDAVFTVDTLEDAGNKIHVLAGDTEWQGSLVANQPRVFTLSVVIIEAGSWPLRITAVAHHSDGSLWDAFEIIQLESTLESGKLIRSRNYTISDEDANRPTPRPFEVSPECSGQPK